MPSPVSYGRRDHDAPEQPCRFPFGYAPQPLPNEPPLRWHGAYREKGKSRLIAGAEGDQDMGDEGGAQPGRVPGPANPTDEERLEQARTLYEGERQWANCLE